MVNNSVPTISDTTPDVGQTLTATTRHLDAVRRHLRLPVARRRQPRRRVRRRAATRWSRGRRQDARGPGHRVEGRLHERERHVRGHLGRARAAQMTNTALPTISDTTPAVAQSLTATPGTWTPVRRHATPTSGSPTARRSAAPPRRLHGRCRRPGQGAVGPGDGVEGGLRHRQRDVGGDLGRRPAAPVITNTGAADHQRHDPEVGQVLTAGDGTWSPAGVTLRLPVALRRDVDIGGATSKTYQVPTGQLGKKLSVRVTATRAEHVSGRRPRRDGTRWRSSTAPRWSTTRRRRPSTTPRRPSGRP